MEGIQFTALQAQAGSAEKESRSARQRASGMDAGNVGTDIREKVREAREKAEQRRDSLKLEPNAGQYGDAAITAYAKLARARNQGEVSAAASYARRQIARCRAALGSNKDNATRIRAAMRQLQKAVSRAGKKSRELSREDLMQAREKKARLEQERRKAAGLRQELNRRRTLRMIREGGYLQEAETDNRQQAQIAKVELELRQQAQALDAAAASLEGAAREYAAASAAPAPAAEVDIQA